MQTILITGGAGFVGSNLGLALRSFFPSSRIIALDNLKRRGSELNLLRLRAAEIEFVHGDVRNPEDLQFPEVELILECSAEPSALAGQDGSTDYLIHTNLLGTYHCLELARRNQASMIFLSTSRVYPFKTIQSLSYQETESRFELASKQPTRGVSKAGISENFSLEGTRTLYGATKLASELLITEYVENFQLQVVINRCGVLTGPWQMGKIDQGVTVLWMARHFFGGELSYLGYGGAGKQVRDLLHIADLGELLRIQIENLAQYSGKVYNVGGGAEISVSLQELTLLCEEISSNTILIHSESEDRPGDVPWFITDSSRIQSETGWKPCYTRKKILVDIYQWIEQNADSLRPILT